MHNAIAIDIRRTFKSGKIFYVLCCLLLCVGIMILEIDLGGLYESNTYTVSELAYAGFHYGVLYVGLCMFAISMIIVDYEYGNIKNICSVTKSRGSFITGKLLYSYIMSLVGTAFGVLVIYLFGMLVFPGKVETGSIKDIVISIVCYSLIADVPITIMAFFAAIMKRASYCSYVLIAIYLIPQFFCSFIKKQLNISLDDYSVLKFAFDTTGKYDIDNIIHFGLLAAVYTVILFIIVRSVISRKDVL